MSTIEKPVACVSATIRKQIDPDIAEFNIWFEGYRQDQASCAEQYTADVKSMKCALSQFGLEDKLRMSNYFSYANRNRRNRASHGFEYSVRGVLRIRRAEHDVSSIWTALVKSACPLQTRRSES